MSDVQGEVRVRSVRTTRNDSFVESAMEFGGGIVRLGFGLFTLPLALLPTQTRTHVHNATRELMYAFASLPGDFAKVAGQAVEDWARESDVAPATSTAPKDEISSI
jgi:hypothetical protein